MDKLDLNDVNVDDDDDDATFDYYDVNVSVYYYH